MQRLFGRPSKKQVSPHLRPSLPVGFSAFPPMAIQGTWRDGTSFLMTAWLLGSSVIFVRGWSTHGRLAPTHHPHHPSGRPPNSEWLSCSDSTEKKRSASMPMRQDGPIRSGPQLLSHQLTTPTSN